MGDVKTILTKEEIKEGTHLIAIYMDLIPNPYDNGTTFGYNVVYENDELIGADWWKIPKYHSSWSWLMPVAIKIHREGLEIPQWDRKRFYFEHTMFHEVLTDDGKELLFRKIVELVKNYNKIKKPD